MRADALLCLRLAMKYEENLQEQYYENADVQIEIDLDIMICPYQHLLDEIVQAIQETLEAVPDEDFVVV